MPSPDYLEHCTDEVVELSAAFQEVVVADMARRLVETGEITPDYLQKVENQADLLSSDVLQKISQQTGYTEAYIRKAILEAGASEVAACSSIAQAAGYGVVSMTPAMSKLLKRAADSTIDEMLNLTGTTAVSSQTEFISAANDAYRQVMSGSISYDQAIIKAIRHVASKGATVMYPSGHRDRLDVAMRRAVLSAVNASGGNLTLMSATQCGCDYVEVTAHSGARPSHEVWQGSICCISGRDPAYPDFYKFTGYGTGAGLCGWNCRHSFHLFFPGFSAPAYTGEMLRDYSRYKYRWNGKRYTEYDCTQQQRYYEREIRKSKRIIAGYDSAIKSAKNDTLRESLQTEFSLEAVKLKKIEAEMKEFCKKTERYVQTARIMVPGFGRSAAQRAVYASKRIRSNESRFIDKLSDFNNGQKDIITHKKLYKNLMKSDVGREVIEYVSKHPELKINLYYKVDVSKGILGTQLANDISIYASNTKTIQRTAETIIHEVTHHRYNIGGCLWSECVCRAQEYKHRYGRNKLTGSELRSIIKEIEDTYSYNNWKWR